MVSLTDLSSSFLAWGTGWEWEIGKFGSRGQWLLGGRLWHRFIFLSAILLVSPKGLRNNFLVGMGSGALVIPESGGNIRIYIVAGFCAMQMSTALFVLTGQDGSEFGRVAKVLATRNHSILSVLSCPASVFVSASELLCSTASGSTLGVNYEIVAIGWDQIGTMRRSMRNAHLKILSMSKVPICSGRARLSTTSKWTLTGRSRRWTKRINLPTTVTALHIA